MNPLIEQKELEIKQTIGEQVNAARKAVEEKTEAGMKALEEKFRSELEQKGKELEDVKGALLKARMEQETAVRPELKSINAGLKAYSRNFHGKTLSAEEKSAMADMEQKAMVVSNGPRAGYLQMPPTLAGSILDVAMTEISQIRRYANVVRIDGNEYWVPTRSAGSTAEWVAETGPRSEDTTLTFGLEKIPVHAMSNLTKVSMRMLDDARFDLGATLQSEGAVAFAYLEGVGFTTGNGAGKPEGIMTNTTVLANYVAQGEASTITNGDALIKLMFKVKTPYAGRGQYAMNRNTLASIYTLVGSDGQYIFNMIGESPLGAIKGKPIVELPAMADIGAGAYPVLFGDFGYGYQIVDKMTDWQLIIDPYTSKGTGVVEYQLMRYVGGQVVCPEAFAVLKVAAS